MCWKFLGKVYFLFFLMFIFERQSTSGVGAKRERDTEFKAGSRLWAVSTEPDAGLELINQEIMPWDEVGCLTNWTTQSPPLFFFFFNFSFLHLFIFERQRETQHKWGRGREQRHRIQSRIQSPSWQHRARRRARTHKPWDHDPSWRLTLNRLSHPGAPPVTLLLRDYTFSTAG